jgi:hypothetical protein
MELMGTLQYGYSMKPRNNIWSVCVDFFKKHELLTLFLAAFIIRVIFWKLPGTFFTTHSSDSIEYYITSINFKPFSCFKLYWGYDYWYERTPVYILFLHVFQQELIFQIILSSLGCIILYKLNKAAGLLWCVYLQEIVYSFQYSKETPLLFFVILSIYLFRNRSYWLLIIVPVIILGFVSYSRVIGYNHALSKGFMANFWAMWKPAFNITVNYSKIFVYIQALPFTLAILYFIRHTRLVSVATVLFCLISVVYCLIYSEPRYREPFMPFLFLFIGQPIEKFLNEIKSVKGFKGKINLLGMLSIKLIRNQCNSEFKQFFKLIQARVLRLVSFLKFKSSQQNFRSQHYE